MKVGALASLLRDDRAALIADDLQLEETKHSLGLFGRGYRVVNQIEGLLEVENFKSGKLGMDHRQSVRTTNW